MTRSITLTVVLVLAACDTPQRRTGPTEREFSSVAYRMEEEARNGRLHPVPPTYRTGVDTRSFP